MSFSVCETNETLLECFFETDLVHKKNYPGYPVYLICKVDGVKEPIRIRNKPTNSSNGIVGIHAEIILIHRLKNRYKDAKDIIVYSTFSPCHLCAVALKQFLDDNSNIKLTLYVAHLYCIVRASCLKVSCVHHNWVFSDNEAYTKANYCGLRYLMSLGSERCKIEAFNKSVWGDLISHLSLPEVERNNFFAKYAKKYDKNFLSRSREREDVLTKEDLNKIKTYSLSKYSATFCSD